MAHGIALAPVILGLGIIQLVPSAQAAPPVSGYARWFDASQITAGDGAAVTIWNDLSPNAANATVPAGNASPTYVANAGMETGLGALYFAKHGGPNDSGALRFTKDSAIRTVFSVFKGNSFLLTDADTYCFHRPGDDSPTDPLIINYGTGAPIVNGQVYVNGIPVKPETKNMPTSLHNGFNLVEILTDGNPVPADSFNKDRVYHAGNQYQAEVILYDRVLSEEERLTVELYLMNKWFGVSNAPDARVLAFGPGAAIGDPVNNSANIAWTVPYGTNVATLAPSFTLSVGATCSVGGIPVVSGTPLDFTNPRHFIVKSSDNLVTTDYTVTVGVTPASSAKDILTFRLPGLPGVGPAVIDPVAKTIAWNVLSGTNLKTLAPAYTVSQFAIGAPGSGAATDFSVNNQASYTITAQDGSSQTYLVTVNLVVANANLISVDFVSNGGSGQTSPCVNDTLLTGTTMNNAAGIIFSGQAGNWNAYNVSNGGVSGLLTNGGGAATTARFALGAVTGLSDPGGWTVGPGSGGGKLRSENAYLYNGFVTGNHYVWALTGLTANGLYKMAFFGDNLNAGGASNVANGVAASYDSEGDWNWNNITADASGMIAGIFTAPYPTLGLCGFQIETLLLANAANSTVSASPNSVTANGFSASTITVTLLDDAGHPATGKVVTLASNRGAADTIAAASGVSNVSGVVTFSVTSTTTGTPVFTATDITDGNLSISQTAGVTFTAIPPANAGTSTVSASPNSVTANGVSTATITVTLKDDSGAAVAGKTVALVSNRGAADLIAAASGVSNAFGVVTFSVKSTTPGTPVFSATDTTDSVLVSATAGVIFTVNPAASAGQSTLVASPLSVLANGVNSSMVTVTLKDGGGAAVAGKTVTLVSNRVAADTISAASGPSDAAGVVTFSVKSATPGAPVFTATDTSDGITVSQTASVTFTVLPDYVDVPAGYSNASITSDLGGGNAGTNYNLLGDATFGYATGNLTGYIQISGSGQTLTVDTGGGNQFHFNCELRGAGNIIWWGAGVVGLQNYPGFLGGTVANSLTGTHTIKQGTLALAKPNGITAVAGNVVVGGGGNQAILRWDADHQVADTASVTLIGPNPARLRLNGHSEAMGPLILSAYGDIYLGDAAALVRFANSSAQSWSAGPQLIIHDWSGSPAGGGSEGIFFGNSASGLTAAQLAKIGFLNPAGFAAGLYRAAILATGEVVPTGSAVTPVAPPYDLSPAAAAARAAIYDSTGRADLTAAGTPLAAGTRIVFFGDSITWLNNYINSLNAALASGAGTQGRNITLVNRGINGGGVLDIRDGAGAQGSFASQLVSDQADIAVVFIGINDVWWKNTPAATFEQALRDIAASAAAQGVPVIFATLCAHFESPIGADSLDPAIDQFSAIVRSVAADTHSTLVDLRAAFVAYWQNNNYEIRLDGSYAVMQNDGILTTDGVHPTPFGDGFIADHMADGILASLAAGFAFDTWIGTGAGGKGLSGSAAAFDADPDHDGIPNGIEFVIGGEPNPAHAGSNSRALLPTAVASGSNLVFTYTLMHAAAYLNPVVEFDGDLQGVWTTATAANATIAVLAGSLSDTVTVTIPKNANTRMFARLKVTIP